MGGAERRTGARPGPLDITNLVKTLERRKGRALRRGPSLRIAGLSLAGWNVLASAALAADAALAARL